MFNWLKKRKEQEQQEFERKLAEHKAELEDQFAERAAEMAQKILDDKEEAKRQKEAEEKAEKEEELRLAKIALDERRNKKKQSNEFYLEIIAEDVTENGVSIEMDWNDACIRYLKNMGIKGPTEEIIVHKYLGAISKDIQMEEIANEYANSTHKEQGTLAPYTYEELDDDSDITEDFTNDSEN